MMTNKNIIFNLTFNKLTIDSCNKNITIKIKRIDNFYNYLFIGLKGNYLMSMLNFYNFIFKKINKNKTNNYFFTSISNFKIFLNKISNIIIGITYNWFVNLEMQGLGFRFFFNRNDKILRLKLGFSHYIMILLNNSIINIKSKRRLGKTNIIISSISKQFLFTLICILIKFRSFNNYKLKGIYRKKFLLLNKLKKGKKKALI